MKLNLLRAAWILFIVVRLAQSGGSAAGQPGAVASKPVYRDPVFDGAADPVIVWNRDLKAWWMFYTNRRASMRELPGVSWVHGTRIGIAESADGANWKYRGVAELPVGGENDTHWAPDVLYHEGTYHMFLTFVPGIHNDWSGERHIHHLTSPDLVKWTDTGRISLPANRVLDATVLRLADGTWRMWYNDETRGKTIFIADSPDLATWVPRGRAVNVEGEGPKAFFWQGSYWLIIDQWNRGISVWRSSDANQWQRQETTLLREPGKGTDDQVHGGHADVVIAGERAYLFYFTHPDRRPGAEDGNPNRSSIQVVELKFEGGQITCDRNAQTSVVLVPPR